MTTSARRCAGCGSSLPETSDDTSQITCSFCGLVNELGHGRPAARSTVISVDARGAVHAASAAGRTVAWIVFAVIAVTLGSVGFGIYTAMKPVNAILQTVNEQVADVRRTVPQMARNQKVAPAALGNDGNAGWRELDVPAPSSGWLAFEPVTDLGWAFSIARAWQKDARLTRIDVDRLKDNGTIDLTGGPDNKAGYRFVSPAQIDAWKRIADRDSKASVPYELMITLAEQKAKALVVRGEPSRQELPPVDADSHPLPELLGLAKRGRGFAEFPFYKGYMIHLDREGWVWYLNSLSGRESLPRVRAKDGATYPYRK